VLVSGGVRVTLFKRSNRDRIDLERMREDVHRSRAQRRRYEQENELAKKRGDFELLRDKVAEGVKIAFMATLLVGVVVALANHPALVPGTVFGGITVAAVRWLAGRPARRR